ncbi:MAG: alpha-(1-_3)-arabinofuranosyltransferase family protein [Acidimicrobiales bacterium]
MTTTSPTAAPGPTVGDPAPGGPRPRGRTKGLLPLLEHFIVAALAFVPLLAVDPGVVTSDTKTYLYLDPTRFLSQVAWMWNPTVALGTVTHEYIGYLLPMGPFYAATSLLHVPTWVAQRLWLGGILFAAGAGILYLCRVLTLRGPGRMVAALAFMLSPYFLQYDGSAPRVILLPWAGLPWMVAFAALALRRGGWRYPALFALVVVLVSGINASSIIYVGVAPVLWLLYATAVEREASWARAAVAAAKLGGLALLCCLWWITGLQVEAAYGVDVLKYTETVKSTSATSSPAEVIRGLGYWYFYGGDRLGPWIETSVLYTQQLWLLALSYLVPVLSFVSAVFVRWRHRAYFVALVVVGVVLSVGAYPYTKPTPVGGVLKSFMSDTTAGLAMRSTDRATPLVLLGLAMLLGAGASALWRRLHVVGVLTALVVAGMLIANNPAIFNGDAEVATNFHQPASLPSYQLAAIAHLNATRPGTRVLAIPGNDFATYRWGDTIDPPQPALLTRPFVTREQQIMGSIATADTLYAMDEPIQTGTEDWAGLAPMARLLSAGDLLVEYDQAYEHFGTPQPQLLAQDLQPTPAGLSHPVDFGTPVPNVASVPTLDEQDLAAPPNLPWPSPLVTYTVTDPRPLIRAESDGGALVVAGDATGLQDLADAGMLNTTSAIYYAGTLDTHQSQLAALQKAGATLVVTDTNRKQAFRYDTITANAGQTETAGADPAASTPSDYPIDIFPRAPLDSKSLATYVGAVNVTASSYGNAISYTPEDRAFNAVDGDLDTAWETGTFVPDPSGQWWQIRYPHQVTTGQITLTQPVTGDLTRWITRATLRFDGGRPITVNLGRASRRVSGQTFDFPARTFSTLRITIDATSDDHARPTTAAAVGFAEVSVPGQHVVEVIKMPDDLLSAVGAASIDNRLTLSMSRERVSPYPPRSDPELTISRQFTLPTARTFTLTGSASISSLLPDDQVDRLVGLAGSTGRGVVAFSKGRLPGDLRSGAVAAIDGDPTTAWQPGFGAAHQAGDWLEYNLARPITFDNMNLEVVADGRHSVPTAITVTATQPTGHSASRHLTLPPITDGTSAGATTTVPLAFPALSGTHIRVTVTGVRLEYTTNYTVTKPTALPLGIAELGIPGLGAPAFPAALPGTCQSNLLSIDGRPVTTAVVGATSTALDGGEMPLVLCGADARGITLTAGSHVLESQLAHTPAHPSTVSCEAADDCRGWNVDQLTLDSAPGGGPEPATALGQAPGPVAGPAPVVTTTHQGTSTAAVTVTGATAPFELVMGQSVNAGWHAVAHPVAGAPSTARSVDLGSPELVDSFANGWPVGAGDLAAVGAVGPGGTHRFDVTFTWAPQKEVWVALAVSATAIAFCVVAGFLWGPWRRLRRRWRSAGKHGRHAKGQPPAEPGAASEPPPALDPVSADDAPSPALPFANWARRPAWWAVAVAALVAGGVGAAISSPLVGVAAGVAVAAGLVVVQVRAVTAAVGVGLLAAGGAMVVANQAFHPLPESSNWPMAHQSSAVLVLMAVVFLGADAVIEAGRRVAARRRRRPR